MVTRLQADGYPVVAPPTGLRSLSDDSAYLASYLKTVKGPIVLVGQSYGGSVITNAATGQHQRQGPRLHLRLRPGQGRERRRT